MSMDEQNGHWGSGAGSSQPEPADDGDGVLQEQNRHWSFADIISDAMRQRREGKEDEASEAARLGFEAEASEQLRQVLAEVGQGEEQASRSVHRCRFKG